MKNDRKIEIRPKKGETKDVSIPHHGNKMAYIAGHVL